MENWFDNVETRAAQWIATYPETNGISEHLNYDGTYCYWRLSKVLATRNPSLAADCFTYASKYMDPVIYEYPSNPDPDIREGLLLAEPPSGSPGYYVYNMGPRMMAVEPSFTAYTRSFYRRLTVGFPRGSAYANSHYWTLYFNKYGDGTYPSATTYHNPVYTGIPGNVGGTAIAREFALALLSHLMADDWFSEFETRLFDGGPSTYLQGHTEFMSTFLDRWYLAPGAAIDIWRDITADLAAAGGDWSQVPDTWTEEPLLPHHEYSPWVWAHTARMLIFYYEDPTFTDDYNAAIQTAVTDMCDWCITYWQKATAGGRNALLYRISDGGVEAQYSSPDLAFLELPMFAWAWSKTGTQAYWDMCVDLAEAGNAEAAWYYPGKWFNELTLWAYHGFQWLGWVDDPFTVFWRE